jgi:hypothetical protein
VGKPITIAAPQGETRTPFDGRISGKPLSPGSYRLTIDAIDLAGNKASPQAVVPFTIATRR